ncbi:MAG TPA: hypothetical protein PLX08_12445 [Bacteroidales bacterium]|jgi:hypothetical protein|nr:hypothetical protein [Bacteroidales bacterium]
MAENISLNQIPGQVALKWIEAYNGHNTDTAISLYDENVLIHNFLTERRYKDVKQ